MNDGVHAYYFAAWSECGCLLGCDHKHKSVSDAVDCESISRAGSYVVAVDNGVYRALNSAEESEFQEARHKFAPVPMLEYEASGYALMVPVRFVDGWGWDTWMRYETYEQAHAHARGHNRIVRFGSSEWKTLRQSREAASPAPPIAPLERQAPRLQVETLVDYVSRLIPSPLAQNGLTDKEAPLRVSSEFPQPTFSYFVLESLNRWELKVLEKICALVVRAWVEALRRRVRTASTEKSSDR